MSYFDRVAPTVAYDQGRADGRREATPAPARTTDKYLGGSAALEISDLQAQILALKQRLVACRAVRDALKTALRQADPRNPLINPYSANPALGQIAEEAAKAVKYDTPI